MYFQYKLFMEYHATMLPFKGFHSTQLVSIYFCSLMTIQHTHPVRFQGRTYRIYSDLTQERDEPTVLWSLAVQNVDIFHDGNVKGLFKIHPQTQFLSSGKYNKFHTIFPKA